MNGARAGEGIHHVGVWQHGAHNRMTELEAAGLRSEARVVMPEGVVLSWFNDPSQLHGVRLDFVDDAGRAEFEHFMRTGDYEGEFRV